MSKTYYVYLLINWNNKVLYIGVTNNLRYRLHQHKERLVKGFTEKYNINKLVYFEETNDVYLAITREKEIKHWRREKKNKLVESTNSQWKDLSEDWCSLLKEARFLLPAVVEMTTCINCHLESPVFKG